VEPAGPLEAAHRLDHANLRRDQLGFAAGVGHGVPGAQ